MTESIEFEDSLMKLAQMAKNRVKLSEFSSNDRFNFIDLFVNNEKTLMQIYDALFPQRQSSVYPLKQETYRTINETKTTQMYKSAHAFRKPISNNNGAEITEASSNYFNVYGS